MKPKLVTCPECNGSGRITVEYTPPVTMDCPCCAGTGMTESEDVTVTVRPLKLGVSLPRD